MGALCLTCVTSGSGGCLVETIAKSCILQMVGEGEREHLEQFCSVLDREQRGGRQYLQKCAKCGHAAVAVPEWKRGCLRGHGLVGVISVED